eukprot:TRINITY_DN68458_c0_g1_i1.p1 TRINITY_DN68458_c0_g1~~TRINITY_DN68458_c0_g1_i1.p1  ORF type:complete len:205 (-),score=25.10 TRINITY_DN68458_c0_g1_i1:37-651(-)
MVTVQQHLLSALQFLHDQLIVHRDVKCENLLLQHRDVALEINTCKLCDFGFAARVPVGGSLRDLMGSPETAAPELIRRMPYSMPVDLWGAGVLLYIGLSGDMPFFADSTQEVLKKVKVGDYSLAGVAWERRSDCAKDFLRGLMTVDPGTRRTAAAALEHPWLRGESTSEQSMPSEPLGQQTHQPNPLRRALKYLASKLRQCSGV